MTENRWIKKMPSCVHVKSKLSLYKKGDELLCIEKNLNSPLYLKAYNHLYFYFYLQRPITPYRLFIYSQSSKDLLPHDATLISVFENLKGIYL